MGVGAGVGGGGVGAGAGAVAAFGAGAGTEPPRVIFSPRLDFDPVLVMVYVMYLILNE